MQFPNWICAILQKMDLFSSPSGPSVGRMRYAPTTGYGIAFEIRMRFPNRIRAILRKTIPFSSPSGPHGGRMQYAPMTRYVPPFEKLSHFRPLRGRLWGVFNTLLRLGTCNPSKYRCNFPTGYVLPFEKTVSFSSPSGPSGEHMRYAPTTEYGISYEIRIQSPNRLRAILRNTDTIS